MAPRVRQDCANIEDEGKLNDQLDPITTFRLTSVRLPARLPAELARQLREKERHAEMEQLFSLSLSCQLLCARLLVREMAQTQTNTLSRGKSLKTNFSTSTCCLQLATRMCASCSRQRLGWSLSLSLSLSSPALTCPIGRSQSLTSISTQNACAKIHLPSSRDRVELGQFFLLLFQENE